VEVVVSAAGREKRRVDSLDVNAAILRGFDPFADSMKLARGGIAIGEGELHSANPLPPDIAIPHYATVLVGGSKSVSRADRLRNDLDPRIWRLRAPIRGIETFARYGRGES
jgi:hypothetical protein